MLDLYKCVNPEVFKGPHCYLKKVGMRFHKEKVLRKLWTSKKEAKSSFEASLPAEKHELGGRGKMNRIRSVGLLVSLRQ